MTPSKSPNLRFKRRLAALASAFVATAAGADAPTLDWQVPLPAGQGWRIVDLREGNGIREEEYVPRGQGVEDYRDRVLVQRFDAQDMNPETYLGHVAAGLAKHCPAFITSGLVSGVRDGLPHATRTAYCARFDARPYGYVIAQKAIRDGDHILVVEREWRIPPFAVDATGSVDFGANDSSVKREINQAVRWLTELHPLTPPPPPPPETPRRRR